MSSNNRKSVSQSFNFDRIFNPQAAIDSSEEQSEDEAPDSPVEQDFDEVVFEEDDFEEEEYVEEEYVEEESSVEEEEEIIEVDEISDEYEEASFHEEIESSEEEFSLLEESSAAEELPVVEDFSIAKSLSSRDLSEKLASKIEAHIDKPKPRRMNSKLFLKKPETEEPDVGNFSVEEESLDPRELDPPKRTTVPQQPTSAPPPPPPHPYAKKEKPDIEKGNLQRVSLKAQAEAQSDTDDDETTSNTPEKQSSSCFGKCIKITCILVVVCIILLGALIGAIVLFDLDIDIPYLDKYLDNDDEAKSVAMTPTPSPSISSPPWNAPTLAPTQTRTWQMLGEPLLGRNEMDEFGTAVALESTGRMLAVGAPNENNVGSIHIYEWNPGNLQWDMLGSGIQGDMQSRNFGDHLAMNAGGDTVATCIPSHSSGAVTKVFLKNWNNTWAQLGQSIPRTGRGGCPISISADGTVVAFSSKWYWPAGIVEVYQFNSSEWILRGQNLEAETVEDVSMGEGFGEDVSLSMDGLTVAVTSSSTSSLRIFDFQGAASEWIQVGQTLNLGVDSKISDRMPVSISANGRIVALGVPHANGYSGLVRVYFYDDSVGEWQLMANELAGTSTDEQLGFSVSLSGSGTTLVVGSVKRLDQGADPSRAFGSVRIYEYDKTEESWTKVADDAGGSDWGFSASVSLDGSMVAAGSPSSSGANGERAGQVRLYNLA